MPYLHLVRQGGVVGRTVLLSDTARRPNNMTTQEQPMINDELTLKRDNRLTAAEARAEYEYRLQERLGMMSPDAPPTEDQFIYARAETMREMREVRKHHDRP